MGGLRSIYLQGDDTHGLLTLGHVQALGCMGWSPGKKEGGWGMASCKFPLSPSQRALVQSSKKSKGSRFEPDLPGSF